MSSKSGHSSHGTLHGIALSRGKAKGIVRIVKDAGAFRLFKKGQILVTPFLTPEYASVVHKAKGVVAETGAIMSHAAVVIRELRIPCLIGVKNACLVLKDGDRVALDTERGIVEVE